MGIARAIERVKRQASQVGFSTMLEGFGEQLRSDAVPAPLRGAAWRIAALLDAACPGASARQGQRARELIISDRAATGRLEPRAVAPHAGVASAAVASAGVASAGVASVGAVSSPRSTIERPMPADQRVPPAPSTRIAEVSVTGVDSGEQFDPPADDTPVSAARVGATPSFNATPVEATPIDATPADEAPRDVLQAVVEVDAASIPPAAIANDDSTIEVADAELEVVSQRSPASAQPAASGPAPAQNSKPAGGGKKSKRKRSTPPAAKSSESPNGKEKLAPASEEAKTLARSTPRPSKRKSGAKADTSKK